MSRGGRGEPAPAPQRAPLWAGVARCGGGRRASPGGVPSSVVRGLWGRALPLPRLPALLAGCWGPLPTCCGCGCAGVGAQHCPLGLHALWGLRAVVVVGGRPRGGWPAIVVRGVWCQALSLSRPPVPWAGQPGFRDPCVPGAVGVGVGTLPLPHGVRLCGPLRKGVPVKGAFRRCEGRLRSGAPPPPTAPLQAGCRGPLATCCGRGCAGVGAQHCPLGLHALWGLRAAGVVGGRPRGGVACHRCEGRLVSGAVPPLAIHPLGRAAGDPQPVFPGCGWSRPGDPPPAPRRAPLRAGVARCGGGGRASPGGVPFAVVKGV